ncbi:hypothetical protein TNCT_32131 [Trichonephila clavata]|uniref:Uncharacterized protein n=1 Tax=Trichonephila clavata TaxID=2740835 RepID=A0A8X6LCT7_TRICU|nr:hypothetical protein TNCT_32131 [Trichonephila clavata]
MVDRTLCLRSGRPWWIGYVVAWKPIENIKGHASHVTISLPMDSMTFKGNKLCICSRSTWKINPRRLGGMTTMVGRPLDLPMAMNNPSEIRIR